MKNSLVCARFVAVLGSLYGLTTPAWANDRHFTQSYETAVLSPGTVEVEPWTTLRLGKDSYYAGLDHRLEFEVGLTDRLQTSVYLNLGSEAVRVPGGPVAAHATSTGISSEWKLKLSDAVADPIGSALYLELTMMAEEIEVEAKILADKRVGPWHLVTNGIYEFEHNYAEQLREHKLQLTGGVAWFATSQVSVGLEAMSFNVLAADVGTATPGPTHFAHGALMAGPVLACSLERGWIAVSVTPQLYGYKGALPGSNLNLAEFEQVTARVLLGVHL